MASKSSTMSTLRHTMELVEWEPNHDRASAWTDEPWKVNLSSVNKCPEGPCVPVPDQPKAPSLASTDVPKGHRITLTPEQTRICVTIGVERNRRNVEARTRNRRYAERSDEDIAVQGVMGEMAFSSMFGAPQEFWDTTCRSGATETRFDARLDNRWSVDVKCTLFARAPLKVTKWKQSNPPDVYALVLMDNDELRDLKGITWAQHFADPAQVKPPVLWFAGLADSREVFETSRLTADGAYYQVPQCDLYTLGELRRAPPS